MEPYSATLLERLESLRVALKTLSDRLNTSGVERTHHLREAMGDDCKWYRKSLGFFEERDYENLRDLVHKAELAFDIIEGKHG